jgi:hypothetical protein
LNMRASSADAGAAVRLARYDWRSPVRGRDRRRPCSRKTKARTAHSAGTLIPLPPPRPPDITEPPQPADRRKRRTWRKQRTWRNRRRRPTRPRPQSGSGVTPGQREIPSPPPRPADLAEPRGRRPRGCSRGERLPGAAHQARSAFRAKFRRS